MAFMVPEYWYGTMYYCPDSEGDYYPADTFSKEWVAEQDELCGEVAEETGWFVRLSAPGYIDATDWSGPYKTEREAREFVLDTYEVHPDTGDEMQWDYVDDDVIERLLGSEEDGLGDLSIYTGDTEGTWGVSTLIVNPVTGSPYVRMFSDKGDAVAYARDRVSKGPSLYYPRRSDQERPERNPQAKIYYVGRMPRELDEEGNRVFVPVYRVLRGHIRGADAILVFENKGVVQHRGAAAIRWKLKRQLSIVGRIDDIQQRVRETPRRKKRL